MDPKYKAKLRKVLEAAGMNEDFFMDILEYSANSITPIRYAT